MLLLPAENKGAHFAVYYKETVQAEKGKRRGHPSIIQ